VVPACGSGACPLITIVSCKSPARRDGYRAYAVAEPDTGIISDEQLIRVAGTDNCDPAVAEGLRERGRLVD
jgi:hypothetical protein